MSIIMRTSVVLLLLLALVASVSVDARPIRRVSRDLASMHPDAVEMMDESEIEFVEAAADAESMKPAAKKGRQGKNSPKPRPGYTNILVFPSQKPAVQPAAQTTAAATATGVAAPLPKVGAPAAKKFTAGTLQAAIASALTAAGITNAKERAMFFGQAHVETGGFAKLREDGYTAANVWSARGSTLTYFKVTRKQVDADYKKSGSIKMFDYMYDDRYRKQANKLGNQPGDGSKYFGRGVLQVTGRANYQKLATTTGNPSIMSNPSQLENRATAISSAIAYWKSTSGLRTAAQNGQTDTVSRLINGNPPNHASQRRTAYATFLKDTRVTVP